MNQRECKTNDSNSKTRRIRLHCAVHPFMSGQIIISTIAKEEQEQPSSSSSSSITESETQVLL